MQARVDEFLFLNARGPKVVDERSLELEGVIRVTRRYTCKSSEQNARLRPGSRIFRKLLINSDVTENFADYL